MERKELVTEMNRLLQDMEMMTRRAYRTISVVLIISGILAAIIFLIAKNSSVGWGAMILLVLGISSSVQDRGKYNSGRPADVSKEVRGYRDGLVELRCRQDICDRGTVRTVLEISDHIVIWAEEIYLKIMTKLLWLAGGVLLLTVPDVLYVHRK